MALPSSPATKIIADKLHEPIKFTSLVKSNGEKMYFCIGKHSLFIVDGGADSEYVGLDESNTHRLDYRKVHQINLDDEDHTLFEVLLSTGEAFYVETPIRKQIVAEVQVFWKTSHMIRLNTPGKFPLARTTLHYAKKSHEDEVDLADPPTGYEKHSFQGFFFFLPLMFAQDASGAGRYLHEDGSYVQITVDQAKPMNDLPARGLLGVKMAAERYARDRAAHSEDDFAILSTASYLKKMNLTGDLASWDCWCVQTRTGTHNETAARDISVVLARRKFVPPQGTMYQDVVIACATEQLSYDDVSDNTVRIVQGITDSLSPEDRLYFFDEGLIQRRADALLLNEESLGWFRQHQDIQPVRSDWAHIFYKSVLAAMEHAGADFDAELAVPETRLVENPFEVVSDFEYEATSIIGLTQSSPPQAWEGWRRRVSRYLAFCMDGGLQPGECSLKDLVDTEKMASKSGKYFYKQLLRKVLQYFLYLAPVDGQYSEDSLLQKTLEFLESGEKLYFNENVMMRLLTTGHLQEVMEEEQEGSFSLLVSLLLRQGEPASVMSVACDTVADMCQVMGNRDKLVASGVITSLVQLLQSSDDDLVLRCGKALVNLSVDNADSKRAIVEEGATSLVVPHLFKKDHDMIKTFSVLLANCMNVQDRDVRQHIAAKVTADGGARALLSLINPSPVEGAPSVDPPLKAALGALWNVADYTAARDEVTALGGVTTLVHHLKTCQNEGILEKVAGVIMVVCQGNDENKRILGESGCVELMCTVVNTSKNKALVRNLCGALAVMSSNVGVLMTMKNAGIQMALERVSKISDRQIQLFATRIQSNLYQLEQ